jgi:glycosyltransferase involved in cell wall biosynthesis
MSKQKIGGPSVTFREVEIVLDRGGAFSVNLPPSRLNADVSFIVDLYDLDNPVHPEGHIGWWRYDLATLPAQLAGHLTRDEAGDVGPNFGAAVPVDEWRNENRPDARRMELLVVLRSTITNAILSIDKIAVVRSEEDLAAFRSAFDRSCQSPRYAPPHAMLPAQTSIQIVAENIFQRDAVGDLCLGLYRMLKQHRMPVNLFADNFDLAMNDVINRRDTLPSRLGRNDVMLYFFSTYDSGLEEVAGIPCRRKIAYFHGVTSPKLLRVFDPELGAVCAKALRQVPLLAKFDGLATNSLASAAVMRARFAEANCPGAVEIDIIPPKIVGEDEISQAIPETVKTAPLQFLYVGRIKSHKRIEDFLHLLAAYRAFDPSARAVIVGRSDNAAYRDYLRWLQTEQLALPDDAVSWLGSVSEQELVEAYDEATVYVSMSEDEGFCLPLLEAMTRNVLVFAYGHPAVRETLGRAGIVFHEKDFEHLARQLHQLLGSSANREAILKAQRRRARALLRKMDGRGFLDLLTISGEDAVRIEG